MKNFFYTTCAIFTATALVLTTGCEKKNKSGEQKLKEDLSVPGTYSEVSEIPDTHIWYSFSEDGLEQVDLPQNAAQKLLKPWTEAIRISSTATAMYPPLEESSSTKVPPAYAIVNHLGILAIDSDNMNLIQDPATFNNCTAGNLVFFGDTPLFSLYKNSFFNNSISTSANNDQAIFLEKYDRASKICIPLVSYKNLAIEGKSQITDFDWNGVDWICSIKTVTPERVLFNYLRWTPNGSILDLSPISNSNKISIKEAEPDDFRKQKMPTDFSNAPDKLQKLLAVIPDDFSYYMICEQAGGFSPKTYTHGSQEDGFGGTALLGDTYTIAIFQDGTTYISGALYNKHIIGREAAVAFRLPKLPSGYSYGNFAISGSYLYVAWEESDFYQTGRSGLIKVNLDKVLYAE
ncbi:MAG: hypothetical protein K6F69_04110 [Treponema sp.]|nr:hypothetical protein [Treponema sp.]